MGSSSGEAKPWVLSDLLPSPITLFGPGRTVEMEHGSEWPRNICLLCLQELNLGADYVKHLERHGYRRSMYV